MAEEAGEKKHEATPYRRMKAREEGQVPRSQDLASAVLLLAGVLLLQYTGPKLIQILSDVFRDQFQQNLYWSSDPNTSLRNIVNIVSRVGIGLLPLMLTLLVTAVVVNLAQSGILFLPDKLGFDISRIDPLKGFGRLFSLVNATRLGFGMLKIILVTLTLGIGVWNRWDKILSLGGMPIETVSIFVWDTSTYLCLQAAVVLVVLAGADYGFQRWKFEQDIRMTDEEIREEAKSTQGDPQIKARRRRVQRELANQRLMQDVPKADAVITNPTELAVAIRYDPKTMKAPIVVAKGADLVAARIRKIALEHGIPIIERKPLAQALFKSVEVGHPVPVQEYAAVAEVLKYVYQVQGRPMPDISQAA